ncbi:MAG: glycerophosphoryl diester phosphodiesterase [Natronomonas sp.]|jgi:glycerophosphoryl diester phosphodiesterase|uniref:glycerophosphodiester phosphodiesterase n=1 Tax=Natronomonas sp. TaxID=2184060 RepID=UPI0039899BF8
MRLIAHRGFAAEHPENTRSAVEKAAAMADAIEIDVRRCASGELVVIHDETVDRVTDGEGRVADLSLLELRQLDVLGTGEGVPTLSEVLRAIPNTVGVNAELKESGTAEDALALLKSLHPQTVVSSFSREILAECREADPSVPRALITDEEGTDSVEVAIDLDCGYVHPAVDVCTGRLVTESHRAGMSVNAWTVETRSEAEELNDIGVDGIIADRPNVRPEISP